MKLLRKLFGAKPTALKTKVEPIKAAPIPVAEPKAPKPVITLDVVEQTNDESELLKLASEGATSQLRQAAAEKTTKPLGVAQHQAARKMSYSLVSLLPLCCHLIPLDSPHHEIHHTFYSGGCLHSFKLHDWLRATNTRSIDDSCTDTR